MMQNTNVIYNMEAVIQFQILFLIASLLYNQMLLDIQEELGIAEKPVDGQHPIKAEYVSYMLLAIHFVSWIIHEYSVYEINLNG